MSDVVDQTEHLSQNPFPPRLSAWIATRVTRQHVEGSRASGSRPSLQPGSSPAAHRRAYTHSWGCITNSADRCFDRVGANPNPWELVDAATAEPLSEICAKAVTPSNNTRTGSTCRFGADYVRADIAGGFPESIAYVYWGGPFGPVGISGFAAT